jgi:hypothetical protein
MEYQFLVADVGSLTNPQSKIIGARIQYKQEYWKFNCVGVTQCQDANAVQQFELQSTVTFYHIDQQPHQRKATNPPFLPSLPQDIFYPFYISSAMQTSWNMMVAVCITIIVLFNQ